MPSAEATVHDTRVLAQLTPGRVHRNLPVSQLVAISLARGESKLTANGVLVAYTGALAALRKTNSSFRMIAPATV